MDPEPLLNVTDYARAARGQLAKDVCDYFEGVGREGKGGRKRDEG